jgi:hypothetical protein
MVKGAQIHLQEVQKRNAFEAEPAGGMTQGKVRVRRKDVTSTGSRSRTTPRASSRTLRGSRHTRWCPLHPRLRLHLRLRNGKAR